MKGLGFWFQTNDVNTIAMKSSSQIANTSRRRRFWQVTEETLYHVEPGSAGGCEVHMKARRRLPKRCTLGCLWVA